VHVPTFIRRDAMEAVAARIQSDENAIRHYCLGSLTPSTVPILGQRTFRRAGPFTRKSDAVIIRRVSTVDDLSGKLEFLQGTLEVLILRSLTMAPNHAYGISQFLKQQSEDEFVVDNGSLYPALQRLMQRQWIKAQWKTSPHGRRAKYYQLTSAGRKQLVVATSKWQRFVEAMGRVLAVEE
jgi:PadR family transcriptional regulator PadR